MGSSKKVNILRSLLFVPGNQERRIGKAVSIPADAVILDLEDSVPAAEKETARSMLPGAISRFHAVAKQVFVRVNSMVTPDCAPDIKIAVASGITGIILPKSESAAVLKHAGAMVTAAEEISGIDAGRTHIIPLVETPKGLININEIAGALPRIIGIAFGGEDYALEMGITRTREGTELYYPRVVISVACHAAGIMAFDTVYTDVRDREGLAVETRAVKQMGFHGKMVIHPDQVEVVNEVFSPSDAEVACARLVVEVFEDGSRRGLASVSLDGKMIDIPVLERARALLEKAAEIAALRHL